jgi:hypothetical protein
MEDTLKLDITGEARARDEEMDQMLVAMRQANEQIARRQEEVKRLQEKTRNIIAAMKEWQRAGAII